MLAVPLLAVTPRAVAAPVTLGAQHPWTVSAGFALQVRLATSPGTPLLFDTRATAPDNTLEGMVWSLSARSPLTGQTAWTTTYAPPMKYASESPFVCASPTGALVFVAGTAGQWGSGNGQDYAVAAFSVATGARVWQASYDGPAHGEESVLAMACDSTRVYLTGTSADSPAGTGADFDTATVAFSAANGGRAWADRSAEYDRALAVDPVSQRVYVGGYEVRALDASSGTVMWAVPQWPVASGLGIDAVHHRVFEVSSDDVTAFDGATGNVLWSAGIPQPDPTVGFMQLTNHLVVDPLGRRVYVASTRGGSSANFALIALDAASGSGLWSAGYDGPKHGLDFLEGAVVSPDGSRLYLGGDSAESTDAQPVFDASTIAVRASDGARLWTGLQKAQYGGYSAATEDLAPQAHGAGVYLAGSNFVPGHIPLPGNGHFITSYLDGPTAP
jgi:hypothetical protein